MMMYPKPVAATASEPVTLAHLRAQVRADDTTEDALLFSYLIAAREMVETDIGQSLGVQSQVATATQWPDYGDNILIPGAVASVTSITYTAVGGASTPWTEFVMRRTPAGNTIIRPAAGTDWPTLGDDPVVTVTVQAGLSPIPERARQAIILLAATWFNSRESVSVGSIAVEIPLAYRSLVHGLGGARVA